VLLLIVDPALHGKQTGAATLEAPIFSSQFALQAAACKTSADFFMDETFTSAEKIGGKYSIIGAYGLLCRFLCCCNTLNSHALQAFSSLCPP
jgi:hypothetical protein